MEFDPLTMVLLDYFLLTLLLIFIIDLFYLYRMCDNYRHFFKKHWFDILMTAPFFRVLRLLRAFKLLRITKSIKFGVKNSEKISKAIKKSKRIVI
jgi:hypothetical protein